MMERLKPIFDLVNDRKSSRKIFKFVFKSSDFKYVETVIREHFMLDINGYIQRPWGKIVCSVSFSKDEAVYFTSEGKSYQFDALFQFVDFVRSLGYSNI